MQLTVSPKHFNQRFISDLLPKTPERKILSHFHSETGSKPNIGITRLFKIASMC